MPTLFTMNADVQDFMSPDFRGAAGTQIHFDLNITPGALLKVDDLERPTMALYHRAVGYIRSDGRMYDREPVSAAPYDLEDPGTLGVRLLADDPDLNLSGPVTYRVSGFRYLDGRKVGFGPYETTVVPSTDVVVDLADFLVPPSDVVANTSDALIQDAVDEYVNANLFSTYAVQVNPSDPNSLWQWQNIDGEPIGDPVPFPDIINVAAANISDSGAVGRAVVQAETDAEARLAAGAAPADAGNPTAGEPVQPRRGTAAEWTAANPVLAEGETGYETDTDQSKRGDGTTAWNSLPYVGKWDTIPGKPAVVAEGETQVDARTAIEAVETYRSSRHPLTGKFHVDGYGAVGDGTVDDTAAVQACINAGLAASGVVYFTPGKTYRISSALQMGSSSGGSSRWIVEGNGATILQATDNTPILVFTKELTYGWRIAGLNYSWVNNQPAANTLAICIYFNSDTNNNYGFYNFEIGNVRFHNGYRGIALNEGSANAIPIWGGDIHHVHHSSLMAGSCIRLRQTASGQPNMTLRQIYVRGDISTETPIDMQGYQGLVLQNIEFNHCITQEILLTTCNAVEISGIRSEQGTFSSNFNGLWTFSDCRVRITGIHLQSKTFSSTNWAFVIRALGTSTSVEIGNVTTQTLTISTGAVALIQADNVADVQFTGGFLNAASIAKYYRFDNTPAHISRDRGVRGALATKTGNYTLTATDDVVFFDGSYLTASLPNPGLTALGVNRQFIIKNLNATPLIVDVPSGQTIDGAASVSLPRNQVLTVVSRTQTDGSASWFRTNVSGPSAVGTLWTPSPSYLTGHYYWCNSPNDAATSAAMGFDTLRLSLWIVYTPLTISSLIAEYTVAGSAGTTFTPYVYSDTGSGNPGALLLDAGAIPTDGTPATAEKAVSLTLRAGAYWVGGTVRGTGTQPTMRTISQRMQQNAFIPLSNVLPSAGQLIFGYAVADGGAAPNPYNGSTSGSGSSAIPRIGFKVA